MSVTAAHELLHALGLLHEQSRSDARNFTILKLQDKQSETYDTNNFKFDYDFGSVMHYGADYIPPDNYNIITLPRFYQQTIGQSERISFKDTAIINYIYCQHSCKGHEMRCKNRGYLNPNDCAKCLCPDGYDGQNCESLELNINCVDMTDTPRELEANQTNRVLKPKIKALRDPLPNDYKNWIEAEAPDVDIIISTHISTKQTNPTTWFELNYEAGYVNLTDSCDCVHPENLYSEKRNPQTTLECVSKKPGDCLCHGKTECLSEKKNCHSGWRCPVFVINGQIRKIMSLRDFNARPYIWGATLYCFRANGASKSFWGYRENATTDPIRVDEVQCLGYKEAGMEPEFKSLDDEHHQFNQSTQTINVTIWRRTKDG
uniref:Astacin domain-containing protein n=1 Tax=Globodera pallida TaxID=36090 RepID=A0A183BMW6_GLOPA